MKSFTFSIPQNIVMGEGALKQLPQIAAKIATRADARLLNRLTGVILTVLGIILIVISFW